MILRCRILLAAFVLLSVSRNANGADLPKPVKEFIGTHCLSCHDAGTARAGFRIDLLSDDFTAGNNAGLWKEVMDQLNSGEMPPKKKPRPDAKEAFAVTSWVAGKLRETEQAAQGAGGRVPLRRMNRAEYANTVRELFSLEEGFARRIEKELPADGKVGGFDRGAASLFMDEGQLAKYLSVADLILDEALFLEKPPVQKTIYDATKVRYVHGLGTAYKNEAGMIVDSGSIPEFVANLKEPLSTITIDGFDDGSAKDKRYVPHGPFNWTMKNGGIEYLSRHFFFDEGWVKKWVTRDGWYRFKIKAGAFRGAGAEEVKDVRLILRYCPGSPNEVIRSVVIDASLDAPKEYEFKMYLQSGPPGMNRMLDIDWNLGDRQVVIRNPLFQDVQWKPIHVSGEIDRAIREKKPAAEIAALRKKSEEAHALALENRKTFPGPYWVNDPKHKVEDRPRLWLGQTEWEGPIVEWPPKGRSTLFFAGEDRTDDAYLREIFAKFLPLAYRRPATSEELDRIVKWSSHAKEKRGLSFHRTVREGVKNILCSPAFLYLGGEGTPVSTKPASGAEPVSGFQFASRLSYLLWSCAPDAELYRLAEQDKLRDPTVLRAQVKRMIADPKATEFVRNFAGQWLGVSNFDNGTPPNRDFYRHYDDALRDSSKREPLEFFGEVLRSDLPLTSFVTSDFLVIDERLAKHYGIKGIEGDQFRRVPVPADGRRGGVLGMAGILTYLADGTRTLPVRRATWVLDTLWNQPVPPPPPNAGDLPTIKGKKLSVRARLDQHRLSENCASCHSRVDPFGLALENFDATGMWRDRQNGEGMRDDAGSPALDVSGKLPGGREFTSVQEFKAALLAEKETFVKGFSEKLLCYALGRPVAYGDRLTVEQIMAHAAKHDYKLQEVIQATVASAFFQTK